MGPNKEEKLSDEPHCGQLFEMIKQLRYAQDDLHGLCKEKA